MMRRWLAIGKFPGGWFLLLSAAVAAAAPVRTPDTILSDMTIAQRDLKGAIGDARQMADPVKRSVIAARATPPLRRLLADERELAVATGRPTPTFFEVQLRAMGAAMGDPESADALNGLAGDPASSLRGKGGLLLARWLQSPGDADAQTKVVDNLAPLDAAHPDSDDLAHFTGLMTGSAATPAVRARLIGLLRPMTCQRADLLRRQMPATRP